MKLVDAVISAAVAFVVSGFNPIAALVAFGATLLSELLTPTPKDPGQQLTVSLDPNQPRAALVGKGATAGSVVTFQTWGDNNSLIILVFAVADHKCTGLAGGWWQGERMTINPDGSVEQAKSHNNYYMWVRFLPGDWNDPIDATLLANSGGRWNSGAWGRGVAKVIVQAQYNSEAHPQGLSGLFQFVWEIQGAALYDRRQDSSVGGSGSQRWNDQASWAWTQNNAVITENFLRGLCVENTEQSIGSRQRDYFFGLNLTDPSLPFATNTAAMNVCDEPVAQLNYGAELSQKENYRATSIQLTSVAGLQTGDTITVGVNVGTAEELLVTSFSTTATSVNDIIGYVVHLATGLQYDHAAGEEVDWRASLADAPTVPRYQANGIISCQQDGQTVLGNLLAAMGNGRLLTGAGINYAMLPGAAVSIVPRPDGAAGPTILDSDLRLDGPHKYQQYVQLDQIVNAVAGKWCNPAQYYTAMALPERVSLADEAADGGRKEATFDVTFATNSSQGQRCQEIYRRRQRAQATAQICLGPAYMCVEGGDWVTWQSARYGWTLTFEVQNARWILDDDQTFLGVVLDLQEIDDDVDGWDPAVDELALVDPQPLPSASPVTDTLSQFTVTPVVVTSPTGAQVPGLQFSYEEVSDPYAVGITFVWGVDGVQTSGGQTFSTTVNIDPTTAVAGAIDNVTVTEGVIGDELYAARAIIVTTGGRASAYTDWSIATVTPVDGSPTETATATTVADSSLNTQNVGTATATQIQALPEDVSNAVTDIGTNTANIATQTLIGGALAAFMQAQTTLAGQPVGTQLLSYQTQQSDANSSYAANFTLLGAKNAAGTAWQFNGGTVLSDGTTTLSTFQTYVENVLGDGETSIASIVETTNGLSANITLSANSNGQVSGLDIGTSGLPNSGYFDILSPKFRLIDTSSGQTLVPLSYTSGVGWVFNANVAINGSLIISGSVTTTAIDPGSITNTTHTEGPPIGSGSLGNVGSSPVNIGSLTLTLSGAAVTVDVIVQINNTDGSHDNTATLTLQRDSSPVSEPFYCFTRQNSSGFSGGQPSTMNASFFDGAATAGSHTYTVYAQFTGGVSDGSAIAKFCRIIVQDLKTEA